MGWVTRGNLKGPTGTIDTATATALPAGSTPTVALGGTPAHRHMAFGIPTGPRGDQGLPGFQAVPTDAGVAQLVTLPSATRNALSSVIGIQHVITNPAYAGGADATGATSSSAAIQAALQAQKNVGGTVVFPSEGTYLMTSGVSLISDDIAVDFGTATIVLDLPAGGYAFTFGALADTPQNSGLTLRGGVFTKKNPAGSENSNYFLIQGTRNFTLTGQTLRNVANGGITVHGGCEDGEIELPHIQGINGYSTCRGIWLNGATVSDYALQLVDIATLTRNNTPVPQYGIKRVTIRQPRIKLPAYGIYSMNAREVTVLDPDIDISGGGNRCVTFNNYSPRGIVKGGRLRADQSATGVMITQFSHDVVVDGTTFLGSFGGGRDIYVQYRAKAQIKNTTHLTDTTEMVMVSMGGQAEISNCSFIATSFVNGKFAVAVRTGDSATDGTAASTVPGVVVSGCLFRDIYGVKAIATTAEGGTVAGFDYIIVERNRAENVDKWVGDQILSLTSAATANLTPYTLRDNKAFPRAYNFRAYKTVKIGSGMVAEQTAPQVATFRIDYAQVTGMATSTKQGGDYLSCTASKSGTTGIALSPRTNGGQPGAQIAQVVGVTAISGVIASARVTSSGSNYLVTLFDAAGVAIPVTSDLAFYVHVCGYDEPA